MLDVLRKPAAVEQITFADGAPKLHANGYLMVPIASGAKVPSVQLVAAAALSKDPLGFGPRFGDEGIAVLCAAVPHEQLPFAKAQASWLIGVQVLMSSKKIAASVDDFIAERFTAAPGVRLTQGTHDRLYIFGLSREPLSNGRPYLPFEPLRSRRLFQSAKNRGIESYDECKLLGAGDWFAYSGREFTPTLAGSAPEGPEFYWRPSADLMDVPSCELPSLNAESAAQLRLDIESLFESAGAERVL